MRAVLTAEIPVERMAVFAEMAWMARRPELGLLCREARRRGDRLSPETIRAVLPGLADAGVTNVRAWCVILGLCDQGGGLTALGGDVAETNEAPVPEQGVYDLWCAEHPLLGRRILAVERLASTRDQRFENVVPLVFSPDQGVVFRSVADPTQRFMLRSLPANHGQVGCIRGRTQAVCRLRWTLDFDAESDQWQLDGAVEEQQGGLRPIAHEPETAGIDLWALMAEWGTGPLRGFGRWQPTERRLAVPLDRVPEPARDTFRVVIKLPRVDVTELGSYENVALEEVPIGPVNPAEANGWARNRLDRYLMKNPAYRARGEVRRVFVELTEGTPLEPFMPTLPAHEALAEAYLNAGQLELFWSISAPVDLAPGAPLPDELAPMKIGIGEVERPGGQRDVVHVPYRGQWSMRRLADRLLGGVIPRRVLLCDRYVRGGDNVTGLQLLVQALREVNPAVAVEVWTGVEAVELEVIRRVTGTRPRTYADVFGRSAPHDRFFLVLPEGGAGFGWQMSNSPLDGRASGANPDTDTPLRSRGLVAARLSGEQLPERLAAWLSGGSR